MKRSWNAWAQKPFDKLTREHVRFTQDNVANALEVLLALPYHELERLSRHTENPSLIHAAALAIVSDVRRKRFKHVDAFLNRIIGRPTERIQMLGSQGDKKKFTFEEFCANAGYPEPYPKQLEMRRFVFEETVTRMLRGSRNYGKTDYCTILGTAYEIYCDWYEQALKETNLIVTKSDKRNAALMGEISKALMCNGVTLEKDSASVIRVKGLIGKDGSVEAVTIGSSSFRGRHPRRVIMDDPVTEEDVSEATRVQAKRAYDEIYKLCSNICLIGQPVHKFDLYEELYPLIKVMDVPHGTIPELDHDLEAMKLAGVSEASISASYHLKVISESGNPLEKVQFIDSFPARTSVAFIDPSFEGGDYTAMSIGTAHFDGLAVKGRVWRKAWYECIDEIAEECERSKIGKICFETNALGEQPVVLMREMLDGVGVVGRKSTGYKHSRIMALGPFAKYIFIAKTSDREYIRQTTKYEYKSKFDDGPDSLASLCEFLGLIRGRN